MLKAKFCLNFLGGVLKDFYAEGCPLQAAGLSYVSLLAVVPLMTVGFSILTAFPIFQGLSSQIQHFVFNNFVASSASIIENQLQIFIRQARVLPIFGTLFLLFMGLAMIFSMERVFNHIWKVKKHRNLLQAFLMYWTVLTLAPILIGIGLAVSSYMMKITFISTTISIPVIKRILFFISPCIFSFLAFLLLYMAVPNCRVKFKHALLGATVAAILFEIVKRIFTFYIAHFPTYKLIYGALATIPIFLIWIYLSWLIILFGASVSHAMHKFEDKIDV